LELEGYKRSARKFAEAKKKTENTEEGILDVVGYSQTFLGQSDKKEKEGYDYYT